HGPGWQSLRRRAARNADRTGERRCGFFSHPGEELCVELRHARRSLLQARTFGVLADGFQQLTREPLDTLPVDSHDQAVAGRACPVAGVPSVAPRDAVASAEPSTAAEASAGMTRLGTSMGGRLETGRSSLESHSGRSGSLRISVTISAMRV